MSEWTAPAGAELAPIYLKLDSSRIAELIFILESYEGLATVRTLNPEAGEIVLLAVKDTLADVEALLDELQPDIGFQRMSCPEGADEDWLLGEMISKI